MDSVEKKAVALFTAVPKLHNCAQAIAAAAGREDLVEEFASKGGGRAEDGICGALYAAMAVVSECDKEALKRDFAQLAGLEACRELKMTQKLSCLEAVRIAGRLVDKYRTRDMSKDLRKVTIERGFTKYAAGSVVIRQGDTWVLCTASVEEKVPPFLRDSGQGWVTAEYSMLPSSTLQRKDREIKKGKPDARSSEIGRLIGRALRAAVDMKKLGERTITIDCDVLQADGGTRCASITGGMVALADAIDKLLEDGKLTENPIRNFVSAISVGICNGLPALDLDYIHDSTADVDLNVIMTADGRFVELQGTAEHEPFTDEQLNALKALAVKGNAELARLQQECRKA